MMVTSMLLLSMGSPTIAAYQADLGSVTWRPTGDRVAAMDAFHPIASIRGTTFRGTLLEAEEAEVIEEHHVGLRNTDPGRPHLLKSPPLWDAVRFNAPVGSGACSLWSCRSMAGVLPCCLRLFIQVFRL